MRTVPLTQLRESVGHIVRSGETTGISFRGTLLAVIITAEQFRVLSATERILAAAELLQSSPPA